MRVIAGAAKGRTLASVPGSTTRPITDRAKEALFSILAPRIPGADVLDLFAGTGSVGIEALSRGAEWCDFVEKAPAAIGTIRENLDTTGLGGRAQVYRRDVFDFLASFDGQTGPYDLVYVAPPQYFGLWSRTLTILDGTPDCLASDGTVVVQIHPREEEPLELERLELVDRRKYGSVQLLFYVVQGGL